MTSQLGKGKSLTFFYSVGTYNYDRVNNGDENLEGKGESVRGC